MPICEVTTRAILGALSALALLAASGCDAATKNTAQAVTVPKVAQPVVVAAEVMPAAPDALIAATGTIVYSQETTLSFKTGGVLTELTVD